MIRPSNSAEAIRTIGFLGVGLMGAPMARHLLSAGFRLQVWNRTRDKVDPLIDAGAVAAATPAEAAEGTDVLCVCVTDKAAVEKLFKVEVEKVRTMLIHGKFRRFGKGGGVLPDWKKAIVTVAKGQKIDFANQAAS